MIDITYLVPDPFDPSRMMASDSPPLAVDPFTPPAGEREWPMNDNGDDWLDVFFE